MTVKTQENNFTNFVNEDLNGFKVIGDYVNESKEVKIFHEKCGKSFSVRPKYFREIKMCIKCVATPNPTQSEYQERVNILSNSEYKVIGEYNGENEKVLKRHKVCGFEWEVSPSHFKFGKRCPKCSGRVRKTPEYFRKEIWDKVGDEYEVRSDYEGAKKKVSFFHNSEICGGNVFKMTPSDFLSGRRCPACADVARYGENHWNYNPNLTEEDRMRRDMQNGEIRKWRDAVYARDEYTCQKCNETGTKLNAHHLNSWDRHPDDRFELSNGVTLCEPCHRTFHMTYGYGSNTAKQFADYISL